MATYVTNGFVLNSRPWREGDRIYTLFTESVGKVEAIAAGSRKVASKLSPHLPPFSEVQIMVARGRQLDRLASANILQTYLKPPFTLQTLILGSALMELADSLTRAGEREPKLINLIRQTLAEINKLPSEIEQWRPAARIIFANYIIECLKCVGLAVTLTHCEECRGELVEPTIFNWTNHGFFHQNHVPAGDTVMLLSPETLGWLIKAATIGVRQSEILPPPVLAFLTDYVIGHTGRQLYTIKVLRSIL